jgi:type IV pilus assembly protein PilC
MLLRMPVLGNLIRKSAVSRFTRTLGTLSPPASRSWRGSRSPPAPRATAWSTTPSWARASIAGGATISEPLKASGVFPPMVVQMINVGEQTGGLDEMLSKIADFYDDEVDAAVSALTSVLEPIMIVVMGVVIGGMVVAMYLPMFDMIAGVGRLQGRAPAKRSILIPRDTSVVSRGMFVSWPSGPAVALPRFSSDHSHRGCNFGN